MQPIGIVACPVILARKGTTDFPFVWYIVPNLAARKVGFAHTNRLFDLHFRGQNQLIRSHPHNYLCYVYIRLFGNKHLLVISITKNSVTYLPIRGV